MEFVKYSSIENSYRDKFLSKIREHVPPSMRWAVQEKVHGANLQIMVNETGVTFASRSQVIEDTKDFYKLSLISATLASRAEAAFKSLNHVNGCKEVRIFGELFGGSYPHPEVGVNNIAPCVQKGVFYSPDLHFYAFDLMVDGELVNTLTASTVFDVSGFFRAKTLFSGTLDECLSYPNDGLTTIPGELGLPDIDGNIMEGVIIKPVEPGFIGMSRVILKNKNEQFSEKQKEPRKARQPEIVSDELQAAFDTLSQYLVENRLDAVLSKVGGEVEGPMVGKIMGMVVQDAMEDLLKDEPEVVAKLEKTERKRLGKMAQSVVRPMVLSRM
jgi:Rnl2 family RNA ligase